MTPALSSALFAASLALMPSGAVAVPTYNISTVPASAAKPLLDSFMTYSLELFYLPDFVGNLSTPNTFTDALLSNLAALTGQKPHIRVGGNTQDYALYDASQTVATIGVFNTSRSSDYPTEVTLGPAFFESYQALSDIRFSHGFNMAKFIDADGRQTLVDSVPVACKALSPDASGQPRLYLWELGNEANLFPISAQIITRPTTWTNADYVDEWLNGTQLIRELLTEHCPDLAVQFMAPSFTEVGTTINAPEAWTAGLGADDDILLFSKHNYIGSAQGLGVTLQGTLMNHTRTATAVNDHVSEYESISSTSSTPLPRLILGETNSLSNQGRPGLSNVFGAALWGVDFALYSASAGIGRVHMHQGTDYRYASWQPIDTDTAPRGTLAPYYGNVAVAATVGDTAAYNVTVATATAETEVDAEVDSVYAVYVDGSLARVLVLNMRSYNTTLNGSGLGYADAPAVRGSQNYTFAVANTHGSVSVQRLLANGSDAITGITWDGWSYNWELDGGQPVRLTNVTTGEQLTVEEGQVTVTVPDASAALLHFDQT